MSFRQALEAEITRTERYLASLQETQAALEEHEDRGELQEIDAPALPKQLAAPAKQLAASASKRTRHDKPKDFVCAPNEKWCSGCRIAHDRSEFNKNSLNSDGLSSFCKKTRRERYSRPRRQRVDADEQMEEDPVKDFGKAVAEATPPPDWTGVDRKQMLRERMAIRRGDPGIYQRCTLPMRVEDPRMVKLSGREQPPCGMLCFKRELESHLMYHGLEPTPELIASAFQDVAEVDDEERDEPGERRCYRCKMNKDLETEFTVNRHDRLGRSRMCRTCQQEIRDAHRKSA